jgi:hypothetical protein
MSPPVNIHQNALVARNLIAGGPNYNSWYTFTG